jgi:DNA-binding phage protein
MKYVHPLSRELFSIASQQGVTIQKIAEDAGLNRRTLMHWKVDSTPNVSCLDAALNVLGYQLVILRKLP